MELFNNRRLESINNLTTMQLTDITHGNRLSTQHYKFTDYFKKWTVFQAMILHM